LGLKSLVITSDGHTSGNPKFLAKEEKKLARAQRQLAKKKKGSKNRAKAKHKVVKNHCLAKSISDVGWGEFIRQLEYKAQWYGRTLVKIDKFYPSSKRCFDCGHILDSLSLEVRHWTCPECGVAHDRDLNAARNILAAGQAMAACGESIRPGRAKARPGKTRRTRNALS
jgi:putative transposase